MTWFTTEDYSASCTDNTLFDRDIFYISTTDIMLVADELFRGYEDVGAGDKEVSQCKKKTTKLE